MRRVATIIVALAFLLTGCGATGVHIGPVELPEKQEGKVVEAPDGLNSIKNIYVEYQDGADVKTEQVDFKPKGVIRGKSSPMVPLASSGSKLEVLGIITNVSIDGNKAQLTYNQHVLLFEAKNKNLFKDSNDSISLGDMPIYQNGTLYVPLLPLLDALDIEYKISGENLTIGGAYTDGSRKTSQG
jgi:hypothetical protein